MAVELLPKLAAFCIEAARVAAEDLGNPRPNASAKPAVEVLGRPRPKASPRIAVEFLPKLAPL